MGQRCARPGPPTSTSENCAPVSGDITLTYPLAASYCRHATSRSRSATADGAPAWAPSCLLAWRIGIATPPVCQPQDAQVVQIWMHTGQCVELRAPRRLHTWARQHAAAPAHFGPPAGGRRNAPRGQGSAQLGGAATLQTWLCRLVVVLAMLGRRPRAATCAAAAAVAPAAGRPARSSSGGIIGRSRRSICARPSATRYAMAVADSPGGGSGWNGRQWRGSRADG